MGESVLSSRLGVDAAIEVDDGLDFWDEVVERLTSGARVDYLICDEAQFYTAAQVEQLARVVDELDVDVHAFGITADFRTELFPGSRRLIELADRVQLLQVEALCWCGRKATHNARIVDGIMVEGERSSWGNGGGQHGLVEYEVICRGITCGGMNARPPGRITLARHPALRPRRMPGDPALTRRSGVDDTQFARCAPEGSPTVDGGGHRRAAEDDVSSRHAGATLSRGWAGRGPCGGRARGHHSRRAKSLRRRSRRRGRRRR